MKNDKKLIYILNQYSTNSSQHFYHILNLLVNLADKGVHIVLIIEKSVCEPDIKHPNITVLCQKQRNSLKRAKELAVILRGLFLVGYKKVFIRISINAALIAIVTAKFFGGEVYYWQSGMTYELDKSKKGVDHVKWILFSYTKLNFIKTYVNHFVTGPESMVTYYIDTLKISPQKMLMLYNDIDLSRFYNSNWDERKKTRNLLGFSENDFLILMVHRLSPVRKTVFYIPDILIDTLENIKQSKVLIIGDGPEKQQLCSQIIRNKLDDKVIFLGEKANRNIQKYYQISDMFINPSYTEGFPRVILEAMASGLPFVATDAGGTKNIAGIQQNKFVIDRDDLKKFSASILELAQNAELRQKIREENLEQVKKYSTENVANMYINEIFKS